MLKDCCTYKPCAIMGKLMMLILTLAEVAALVAVYKAHFGTGGATFGSTTGSLSLMALAINTAVWTKYGQMHCPGSCSSSK